MYKTLFLNLSSNEYAIRNSVSHLTEENIASKITLSKGLSLRFAKSVYSKTLHLRQIIIGINIDNKALFPLGTTKLLFTVDDSLHANLGTAIGNDFITGYISWKTCWATIREYPGSGISADIVSNAYFSY